MNKSAILDKTFVETYVFHLLFRPEEHQGPAQEDFQLAYVKYIQDNLQFRPHIVAKVRKTLKRIAKKLDKKPKDVTYVGIHNRRTDHFEMMKRRYDMKPIPTSYFTDAMEYFR